VFLHILGRGWNLTCPQAHFAKQIQSVNLASNPNRFAMPASDSLLISVQI
jgi:hypothetical protein